MTVNKAVEAMAARLSAIEWSEDYLTVPSRLRLMEEYLRRSALWARHLGVPGQWPFFDIAGLVEPGSAVDPELVRQVVDKMDERGVVGPNHIFAQFALRFASLGEAPSDLPDPFEPLLQVWERGGNFGLEAGSVLIGHTQRASAFFIADYLDLATPYDIDEATLDRLDAPWRARVEAMTAVAQADADEDDRPGRSGERATR